MTSKVTRRGLLKFVLPAAAALSSGSVSLSAPAPAGPIRLHLNENPFGPSKRAQEAIRAAAQDASIYADEEADGLRRMIAAKEGLRGENVIVGEGSGELLKLAALIHAGANQEVVAARPTFVMLPQYAAQRGATVVWVNLDRDLKHDLSAMESRIGPRTAVVYICNPNNPSGTLLDAKLLRAFIGATSPRALIVVDEAYLDFSDAVAASSMVDQVQADKNVLITRSFSKLHALAGQRVGYALGSAATIRKLETARMSTPNRAGLLAAMASYTDAEFQAYSRRVVRESVATTSALFDELKVKYVPSQTNFVMFDTRRNSAICADFMRTRNVLIRPVMEAPGTWARVSMGRPEAMQVFAAAARAFFAAAR